MENNSITDKEWLDLAWKYFQQHAQQRVQYFNYFVVFSTILTTGLITTFQANFKAPYLGIGLGLIQAFLGFIFWKIDERNSWLTKHAEDIPKTMETDHSQKDYKLFSDEEIKTIEARKGRKFFLEKQFTHGKSYRIIFITFSCIGIIGAAISLIFFLKSNG